MTEPIKLRCVIIDDEPLAVQLITGYVERTPFLTLVGSFLSASDAVKPILSGDVDLVFLDIHMSQLSGLEFAKIIPHTCRIVFITAYEKYAIDGFKVNALDYLLKPVDYSEFLGAATRALEWKGRQEVSRPFASSENQEASRSEYPNHIIVKSEYKLVQINVNDIEVVECQKDYVKFYVSGDEKPVVTLMSMKWLEQMLSPDMFLRVHRSFIVNTSKIKVIDRNSVVFGKHHVPISDTYRPRVHEYVNRRSIGQSDD